MNKFYLIVLFFLTFNFSYSAPVIKSVKDGNWNQASTWNLNRLPKLGDTIEIAAGNTVILNKSINIKGAAFLKIFGRLTFQHNSSTLALGKDSYIWVFSGAMILGGGSASQKLKLGDKILFKGKDDAVYGPVMASSSSNGFAAMVNSNPITLPVKFVEFAVTKSNKDVLTRWSTSQEINVNMYQVERSFDGTSWKTLAYVAATGNASSINNYSYSDKNISAKIAYYRIVEVDKDGKTTVTATRSVQSEIASASASASTAVRIASTNSKVFLQFPQPVNGNIVVRFIATSGEVVDQQTISNPVGQVLLNSKVRGIYIISIMDGNHINTAKQVLL